MPRGGARPGAGRKKGSTNWRALIEKPVLNGISPLDFMLAIVACPEAPTTLRFMAAKEAAPYVHRKLAPLPAPKGGEEGDGKLSPEEAGWEADLGAARPN